jgi:hypothetical protein
MLAYSSVSISSRTHERGGISRLLTAAVVNRGFRSLLLTNPEGALARGYQGEYFRLDSEQRKMILSIRADTLADFASQITASGS